MVGDVVTKSLNNELAYTLYDNEYIDQANGSAVNYSGWKRTDFILIANFAKIVLKSSKVSAYNAYYESADEATFIKKFVVRDTDTVLTPPANAKYIRLSNTSAGMDALITSTIPNGNAYIENTRNLAVGAVESGTINETTGTATGSTTLSRLVDFVRVKPNTLYYYDFFDGTGRAYFYTDNKTYISYTTSWHTRYIFKTPDQCTFIRLSFAKNVSKIVLSEFTNDIYAEYIPLKTITDHTARETIEKLKRCTDSNVIKVCTFNVGKWYDGKTRVPEDKISEHRAKWLDFIGSESLDILCVNEAPQFFDVDETITPFDSFLKTNFNALYNETGTNDHENAVATRRTIDWVGYASHGLNTGSVDGNIYCNGRTIRFVCMHLSTEKGSEGRRVADMQRLADWLSNCEYGIVFGDFNAFSKEEYNIFSNFNMANCGDFGDLITWPHTSEGWPFGCIDNIITTKNIEISYAYIRNDIDISDHKPLIARLLVK